MRPLRRLSIASLLLLVLAVPAAAQVPAFTVDELLKLHRVSDAQLSPDGRLVAYVVTAVDQAANTRINDIWVVPVAGGEPVRIASSERSDDRPRWSPDGKRLAFISSRGGSSQIWMLDLDPQASSRRPGEDDGARRITNLATEAAGVVWSPDGRWLAFVSDVFPECKTIECNERKLKEREESKVRARLLEGLLFRHWSSWKDDRYSHLFIVPSDGSLPRRDLTPGAADVPPFSLGGPEDYAFSPDSREIAFVRKTDPVEALSTNSDLFLLDLTDPSATPRQITRNPAADNGPLYSPDGRYIAYLAQERAGFESDRWQLMLYDRKSGEHRSITSAFDRSVGDYTWTPDSSGLFITAEDEGSAPIFRLGLDGGAPKAIVRGVRTATCRSRPTVARSSSRALPSPHRRKSTGPNSDGSGVTPVTRTNERSFRGSR
jgi:Tol biopolymer transport system component